MTHRIWFIGISGSGKTTASLHMKQFLKDLDINNVIIDGDDVRKHVSTDLGFELSDRLIQVRRISGISYILAKQGITTICSSVYMNSTLATAINDQFPTHFINVTRSLQMLEKMHPTYLDKRNVVGKDITPEYDLPGVIKVENTTSLEVFLKKIEQVFQGIIKRN